MKNLLCLLFFSLNVFSFEEVINREIPLKGIEEVWVENVNGNISVYGKEVDKINIRAIKRAEKEAYLKNLNVKIEKEGKVLHIQTEHSRSYLFGFLPVKMGGKVEYKIEMPKNLSLKVETVNGNVFGEDLKGYIKAESINGEINFKRIEGNGSFETVNGDILIEILNLEPNINLESVNGNINIKSNQELNVKYKMEVVNGKIKVLPEIMEIKSSTPKEIRGTWGSGKGNINIETVNGNVIFEILKIKEV